VVIYLGLVVGLEGLPRLMPWLPLVCLQYNFSLLKKNFFWSTSASYPVGPRPLACMFPLGLVVSTVTVPCSRLHWVPPLCRLCLTSNLSIHVLFLRLLVSRLPIGPISLRPLAPLWRLLPTGRLHLLAPEPSSNTGLLLRLLTIMLHGLRPLAVVILVMPFWKRWFIPFLASVFYIQDIIHTLDYLVFIDFVTDSSLRLHQFLGD